MPACFEISLYQLKNALRVKQGWNQFCCLASQVRVIPKAVGAELGELQIRFYPNMPGNSTCHVQEKVELQGEMMPELFLADAEDCVCPVTTVSQLMKDHGISHIDLLKVWVQC